MKSFCLPFLLLFKLMLLFSNLFILCKYNIYTLIYYAINQSGHQRVELHVYLFVESNILIDGSCTQDSNSSLFIGFLSPITATPLCIHNYTCFNKMKFNFFNILSLALIAFVYILIYYCWLKLIILFQKLFNLLFLKFHVRY